MRRTVPFLACCAALVVALPAAAKLVPVQRTFGDRSVPRVRAGILPVLPSSGRVRVIARLSLPPLAQYSGAQYSGAQLAGRGLLHVGSRRRLSVESAGSRAYLRRLEQAQA
ncbi:MAG TPA: hypothetical protein VF327_03940, partial [Gaiellaceae bacterium]